MAKTKATKLSELRSAQQPPQQEWGAQAEKQSRIDESEEKEAEVDELLADVEDDLKETDTCNKTHSGIDVEDALKAGAK
jgi:hypothetical protein